MLGHPAKLLPQGQMGDQIKHSNTLALISDTGPGHIDEHAEAYLPPTHAWVDCQLTSPGPEEDFKLQPHDQPTSLQSYRAIISIFLEHLFSTSTAHV